MIPAQFRVLAHAVGSKVEAAYRRGDLFDKRRELMTLWERFLLVRGSTLAQVERQGARSLAIFPIFWIIENMVISSW